MLRCRSCTATLAFLQCGCHFDQSCAAASEKLQCNIEKAALQGSGAFLPLACGFQAPTFRHPRLGPAELSGAKKAREEILHKEVWGPQGPTPPPLEILCVALFLYSEKKRDPKHKEFAGGQGSLEGSGREGGGVWVR